MQNCGLLQADILTLFPNTFCIIYIHVLNIHEFESIKVEMCYYIISTILKSSVNLKLLLIFKDIDR